jgi:type II secretory pathway component PulJ
MILDSMTLLAMLIALTTSVVLITLAIRQNAYLTRENTRLRRELRRTRSIDYYMPKSDDFYRDTDVAKEDAWTNK